MFKFLICLSILFFSACSLKNQTQSQVVNVSINAPLIKFSEQGFLYVSQNETKLEVYKLGNRFFELKLRDKICLNQICYAKEEFNKKFFNHTHYEDMMQDIINFQPLYNGINLQKNACGFAQHIQKKDFDMIYSVCGGELQLKDSINRLFVRIVK